MSSEELRAERIIRLPAGEYTVGQLQAVAKALRLLSTTFGQELSLEPNEHCVLAAALQVEKEQST